jgi:hypothetical protein
MSKQSKTRRRVTTVAIGLGVFTSASFAFAAWTTISEPWAAGKTGTAAHPTVTDAKVAKDIFPGYCEDVTLTIKNNNPAAVSITGIGNNGFRAVSDTAPSEGGHANRLEDFLYQADVSSALNGKTIAAGESKSFTVPDAVCLKPEADDARQAKTFEAGYSITYQVVPGNEAH